MSYSALKKMRETNQKRFSNDEVGPFEPDRFFDVNGSDMKSAALRFIHERCEGLKFDSEKENEYESGNVTGKSIGSNQIPYNMQMDINRLCLERELEHFIDSGVAEDAYNVYFCFLEIFFGHFEKSKKMIELLSEFESNGSSLLMKHRDHYSHSVYVFVLGLAIYETNLNFRSAFQQFYGLDDSCKTAAIFLEYWGITSLFHDIGYPFELPFEQVMAYFEVENEEKKRGKDTVLISYSDVALLTKIPEDTNKQLQKEYGRTFSSTSELFAFDIFSKLGSQYGLDEKKLLSAIERKPTNPADYGYYMDHAWFSANRLFRELTMPESNCAVSANEINRMHVDALTAILLHNSLYKFFVADKNYRTCPIQLKMNWHPLAYLLMLCDELQCWDRIAYGRNSRKEFHPMGADFDFADNRMAITYFFDAKEEEKIRDYKVTFAEWANGKLDKTPKLKAYSDMWGEDCVFISDINHIVDTLAIPLSVKISLRELDRKAKHTYLSESNFLHLYDFAVALHNRYSDDVGKSEDDVEKMEICFDDLSLEYKLSNINQAKYFSRLLHLIGCFYTDRSVDFDMVDKFTPRQTAAIAPLEHKRWLREHREMGWTYGNLYETCTLPETMSSDEKRKCRKNYREQLRMHKLAMNGFPTDWEMDLHYNNLPPEEQGKDIKPFNKMLELIKLYDGLRIYNFR